jgi:hypothetical protein
MNKIKKSEQKLIAFSENSPEIFEIQSQITSGEWYVTSLFSNGKSFVGILEKRDQTMPEGHIYIPPRKKIKFTS